jgi:hypothetical protein
MTAELTPAVRDRAANFAVIAMHVHESASDQAYKIVDAVVAALAKDYVLLSRPDAEWLCGVVHGEAQTEQEYDRAHRLLEGDRDD